MRGRIGLFATLLTAASACGGAASPADAGAADAGTDAPVLPESPAPPVLTPCPDGWREVMDESGVVTCDPWPETGHRDDCAFDEAHFPGTPGCERVGTACPADGWPDALPTDRPIVFVDDDAAPGGDGLTRATAYGSLRDALSRAPAGAVVAVADGRYDVTTGIMLPVGVVLWGACIGLVHITSSVAANDMPTLVLPSGAGVRNLSLDAPARIALVAVGEDTTIDDVVVTGARALGVVVQGSATTMTVRRLVVRATETATDGTLGHGLVVQSGARLVMTSALLESDQGTAMIESGDGTVSELRDVGVLDTLGRGIEVRAGARLLLARALIERTLGTALIASGADIAIELRDAVIRHATARGIEIADGAQIVLERALIEHNHDLGALVRTSAVLEAHDVVIRDTQRRADGNSGRGVEANLGARLLLERAVIERNHELGLAGGGMGTMIELRDVSIRNTRQAADASVRGLELNSGATLVWDRGVLDRNVGVGLRVGDTATVADVRDLRIRDTLPVTDGSLGRGAEVTFGAALTLTRAMVEGSAGVGLAAVGPGTALVLRDAAIESNHEFGLFVDDGASVNARALTVRDTLASATGEIGIGIWAQYGSLLDGNGVIVQRNRFVGIASVTGAIVTLADVHVSDVQPSGCPVCTGESGGYGASAHFGGRLTLSVFTVRNAALCGIVVGRDGPLGVTAMDLANGVVEQAPIGACVQVDGYDTSRLRNMVEYRDVGVPLQATSYELPDALSSL